MIYGYSRVSTMGQANNGNSLEAQSEELKRLGCEEIFLESYTGTKKDRPQLDKLMNKITCGDTLMVTKIDRLTRNLRDGLDIIQELVTKGVTVNILNFGIVNNSPSGKLMLQVFMAFAEFERNMIVERTQEGRRIAMTKEGYQNGRPQRKLKGDILENYYDLINHRKTEQEIMSELGIHRSTFYRRLAKIKLANV